MYSRIRYPNYTLLVCFFIFHIDFVFLTIDIFGLPSCVNFFFSAKESLIDFFGFVASIFWYPYFSVFFSATLNISLGCTEHQHDQFPCLHLVNHLCKRKRWFRRIIANVILQHFFTISICLTIPLNGFLSVYRLYLHQYKLHLLSLMQF